MDRHQSSIQRKARIRQKTEHPTFAGNIMKLLAVPGLQWLLNTPKIDTVAIDEDGWPVPLKARDPVKKPRDLAQARAVAKLVRDEMPQFSFEETLTSLHGDVREMLAVLLP